MPADIRIALIGSLFGTLPLFLAAILNTLTVSILVTVRHPEPPFLSWCALEVAICLTRLIVLATALRAAHAGRETPTDIHLLLSVAWAGNVGYGTALCLSSGDWATIAVACLSAAAMVGGICFRNFPAPRLAGLMILLSVGPCCIAAPLTGDAFLLVTSLQMPFYLVSMTTAAYRLNSMLVATMRTERENAFRARHDALTGLLNRLGLDGAMTVRQTGQGSAVGRAALLYVDLDGFKTVNDTHGHGIGDRLLQRVADRLRGSIGPEDVVARLGGDEFVVLTRDRSRASLAAFAERLVVGLSEPYDCGAGIVATIGASVGIAQAPEHGADLESLLTAADVGLYRAKSRGKSRSCFAPTRGVGHRLGFADVDGEGISDDPVAPAAGAPHPAA